MKKSTYSLWLAGATAVLVDDRSTAAQRQDTLYSLLYAQLQAEHKHSSRFANYRLWSCAYRNGMVSHGWTPFMRKGLAFNENRLAGKTPLDWLAGYVLRHCPETTSHPEAAVKRLQQLPSSPFAGPAGSTNRYAVHELAVMRPGRELMICGLGLQHPDTTAVTRDPQATGGHYLNAWHGALDEGLYAEFRHVVRDALSGTQAFSALIKDLGPVSIK